MASCGGVSRDNGTYFVNPNHPDPFEGTGSCQLTVQKISADICQVRYGCARHIYIETVLYFNYKLLFYEALQFSIHIIRDNINIIQIADITHIIYFLI